MEISKKNKHLMDPLRPVRNQSVPRYFICLLISQSKKSINGSSIFFFFNSETKGNMENEVTCLRSRS